MSSLQKPMLYSIIMFLVYLVIYFILKWKLKINEGTFLFRYVNKMHKWVEILLAVVMFVIYIVTLIIDKHSRYFILGYFFC